MRRGEVYELRPSARTGHEQRGKRFGVLVQSDALLPRSVVLIAPTSMSAQPATFRPEASVRGQVTCVLVEQTGPVDVSRLGDVVGFVSPEEQWAIDDALQMVLDLR